MGYVAVKGGREAIENAASFLDYRRVQGPDRPLEAGQIRDQLHFLVDRVMAEGSLYAPDLAALAIKQAAGDALEAAFLVRAYRTTRARVAYSVPTTPRQMRVIRRISSAFKDIPGGQVLGPTPDYTLRLLNFDLFEEKTEAFRTAVEEAFAGLDRLDPLPETFSKVVDLLREEGLLAAGPARAQATEGEIFDVTRESLRFPATRSAVLQSLARGETGSCLCLAYSNMRGYGAVHPTIGELRVGYLPLQVTNPQTERVETIGEVKVTEAEIISKVTAQEGGEPQFALGYGLCFGHNETKAISQAVLDRAIQNAETGAPSEDAEFVLQHIDGIESMGFANHFKLPHYVTFQSSLDRLRKAREYHEHEGVGTTA